MSKIRKLLVLLLVLLVLFISGCNTGYTITLMIDQENVYKTVSVKDGESLDVDDPTKEGHTFDGWYLNDTKVTSTTTFSEDSTLYAKFIINKYTYKFLIDGEVYKEETAEYGSTIEFPSNPVKKGNQENEYVFDKWDNSATTLLKDEVFNAVFTTQKKTYEYIFMDDDGTIIKEETAVYGSEIIYPENPTKEETDECVYTFKGWDLDVTILTEDVVFVAIYSSTIKQYTYKFVNDDGSILKEDVVDYGTMPVEPDTTPTKESSGDKKYIFAGWDKTISPVTGDVVYTATYSEVAVITSLENKVISILGDSISTFYKEGSEVNSYYGGENQFYYPIYSSTIKTVDKTWWYQLVKNTKMTLGINNSWSGSCAVGTGASAGNSDNRINTIDDNGNPDIVIIYLGTNDCAGGYAIESYKEAIEVMITKVRKLTNAQIFLTTLGYSNYTGNKYKEENRLIYNETIRSTAEKFDCGIVPLDEYIVDDNYMYYLQDFLHYNAEGAKLLSKIYEKAIKEYNGIEFNEEIEVLHKEKLPEGVLGKITATANTGFWTGYTNNVYLFKTSASENPTYSTRIEFKLNTTDNKYYVSKITKSGESVQYNSDYVLIISDAHEQKKMLVDGLENVTVGSLVEFDATLKFPVEITFKEGNGTDSGNTGGTEVPEDKVEEVEGKLAVGSYNDGVWTKYETTVIIYSNDKIDKASTYVNFYIIKLTKSQDNDKYTVTGLKTVNENATFDDCEYYVLIYSQLEAKSYFEEAKVGDLVTVEGDITSGKCYLVFE